MMSPRPQGVRLTGYWRKLDRAPGPRPHRSLALKLAPLHINANAISPGLTRTSMTMQRTDGPQTEPEEMPRTLWDRPGEPRGVARLVYHIPYLRRARLCHGTNAMPMVSVRRFISLGRPLELPLPSARSWLSASPISPAADSVRKLKVNQWPTRPSRRSRPHRRRVARWAKDIWPAENGSQCGCGRPSRRETESQQHIATTRQLGM
jgi:Enoyl-(Acyl carrier protein) reductase